jgi:hypothetical protein
MKKTLAERVKGMKKLATEFENGNLTWEDQCGYSLNSELLPFINLSEEYDYDAEELRYA